MYPKKRKNTEHDPNRARIRRQSNVSKYRASQKSADVVCGPIQGKNREDPNGEYEGSVVWCGVVRCSVKWCGVQSGVAQYGARHVMKSVICPRRDGAAVEDERQPRKIIIINMLLLMQC